MDTQQHPQQHAHSQLQQHGHPGGAATGGGGPPARTFGPRLAPFEKDSDPLNAFSDLSHSKEDDMFVQSALGRLSVFLSSWEPPESPDALPFTTYLTEPESNVMEDTRCIINNLDLLKQGGDFAFVGFFGFRKNIITYLIEQHVADTNYRPLPHEQRYVDTIKGIVATDEALVASFKDWKEDIAVYLTSQKSLKKRDLFREAIGKPPKNNNESGNEKNKNERGKGEGTKRESKNENEKGGGAPPMMNFIETLQVEQPEGEEEEDGEWDRDFFNVVIMRNKEALERWFHGSTHQVAVRQHSPLFYSHLRLHNGALSNFYPLQRNTLEQETPMWDASITSTKYIRWSDDGVIEWRAYRQSPAWPLPLPPAEPIEFASFLSSNAYPFYSQIVAYLTAITNIPTRIAPRTFDHSVDPPREIWADPCAMVDHGSLKCAFLCGLHYVERSDKLQLLGAPVLMAERYRDSAIYFSDVIVKAESAYQTITDLQGKVFAFNEEVSFSGYVLPMNELNRVKGSHQPFEFGGKVQTGSHMNSIEAVVSGSADFAAIDSVVLDTQMAADPSLTSKLRVIAHFGPTGMPPVVAAKATVSQEVRDALGMALTHLHEFGTGQKLLQAAGYAKYVAVDDSHYNDIRTIYSDLKEEKL